MHKISLRRRAVGLGVAGLMLLSAGPTWAGSIPAGSAGVKAAMTDTVIHVRHRHHRAAVRALSAMEAQLDHRSKCWVVVDHTRNFGYMKC